MVVISRIWVVPWSFCPAVSVCFAANLGSLGCREEALLGSFFVPQSEFASVLYEHVPGYPGVQSCNLGDVDFLEEVGSVALGLVAAFTAHHYRAIATGRRCSQMR